LEKAVRVLWDTRIRARFMGMSFNEAMEKLEEII